VEEQTIDTTEKPKEGEPKEEKEAAKEDEDASEDIVLTSEEQDKIKKIAEK
jgi:hypothetical protein